MASQRCKAGSARCKTYRRLKAPSRPAPRASNARRRRRRAAKRNLIPRSVRKRRSAMTLGTILLIVLILLVLGAVPAWPYSRGWGYFPSGILGVILAVVIDRK